jgi:hypothetical protein
MRHECIVIAKNQAIGRHQFTKAEKPPVDGGEHCPASLSRADRKYPDALAAQVWYLPALHHV